MKLVIIGGGLLGTLSAYYAHKNGLEVVLIEKNKTLGSEASLANGCQLSYSHIDPICQPSLAKKIKLSKKEGCSVTSNEFYQNNINWIKEFQKNAENKGLTDKSYSILAKLSKLSKNCYNEIIKDLNIEFSQKKSGMIHIFNDSALFTNKQKKLRDYNAVGLAAKIITNNNIETKFPHSFNLKNIKGGIYFPGDEVGDAYIFCREIANYLKDKISILYDTEIKEIIFSENKIEKIKTENREITGDIYINCLGASAAMYFSELKNILNKALGYSITLEPKQREKLINIPALIDIEHKIVFSPLGYNIRIAGLFDFNQDKEINLERIELIKNRAKLFLPQLFDLYEITNIWSGFRPISVDGLPLIGSSKKYQNLFHNCGHANLGWTLAAASGKISIENILQKCKIEEIISANRF